MDDTEIKLRCIEAAAHMAPAHPQGPAASVREIAQIWFTWIKENKSSTMGLPKK